MTKNGCHNRPPLRKTAWVQSGWIDGRPPHDGSLITKYPRMIEIPDPLSKHCQYQRDKKDDPKCEKCIWKDVPPVDTLNAGSFEGKFMNNEQIARVAHEVNKAYCEAMGDTSQPAWEDAPQWQRDSAMLGVKLHTENPDAGPQASHESWMAQKVAEGWVYGPTKNPELKQHHCLVPFDQLPREQQAKDFLFRGVVHALRTAV